METKKTKGGRREINLPGNTVLYQPHRISQGKYRAFTLTQSKILVLLIKELQPAILAEIENRDWSQLNLFEREEKTGIYKIGLQLSHIGHPRQYAEIYEAIKAMQTITVDIPSLREGHDSIATLFTEIEIPRLKNGKSVIYVHILDRVAERLVALDKNEKGKGYGYIKYIMEVALNAKCRYTILMYWVLMSFKDKGGFRFSYETLRKKLGISIEKNEKGDYFEYPRFDNFMNRVLRPIQEDLQEKAPCWFNCAAPDFVERDGKKPAFINFKIITPEFEEEKNLQVDNIRNLLMMHVSFTYLDLERLRPLLTQENVERNIIEKVIFLIGHVKDSSKGVREPIPYIIDSLFEWFDKKEWLQKKLLH